MDNHNGRVAHGHVNDVQSRDTQTMAKESHRYTDTPQDAVEAFAKAGLPIKLRTAQRYCEKDKIKAIRIDPETSEPTNSTSHYSWAIDPSSYEAQWARMREQREREARAQGSRQGHVTDATGHDESRQDATDREDGPVEVEESRTTSDDSVVTDLREQISELEKKLVDAEVEKRAAHQVRDEVIKQSRGLVDKLERAQYALGAAESQLTALQAPMDGEQRPEAA